MTLDDTTLYAPSVQDPFDSSPLVGRAIQVLDHGFIDLIQHMGSDDMVAEAARVSYQRGTKRARNSAGLIGYLYTHRHMTPFEVCAATFHIRCPVFVARQWERHRSQSYNELSQRYSIAPGDDYLPAIADFRAQDTANRQGSAEMLPFAVAAEACRLMADHYQRAEDAYQALLQLGVSREVARIVLPTARYTELYATASLRNWMAFLDLRLDSHAQPEIREYAKVVRRMLAELFPLSMALLKEPE